MKTKTKELPQKVQIFNYLKQNKRRSLTRKQARIKFGCDSLPQRIKDLKRDGHEFFPTEYIKINENTHVGRYRLKYINKNITY